jgi:hypothetical protein
LRASQEPTDDPVELERRLLAQGPGARDQGSGARDKGRWTLVGKLAVALTVALVISYLLMWAGTVQQFGGPEGYVRRTDFISTLTGGLIIREGNGQSLYDLEAQRTAQNRVLAPYSQLDPGKVLPYNHIPFEAMLVSLMVDLPFPLVFALWTLTAGLAIGLALGMMDGALPVTRSTGWVMSLAACSYLPLIRSLMLGQNSPLVLMGLCATYVAIRWEQPGWAGASLLLVALKPQVLPIVILLLILQRQWKPILIFAILMAALSLMSAPVLGFEWPLQYVRLLLGVAGWSDPDAINPAIMHNWRGFSTNLFDGWLPGAVSPFYILMSLASVGLVVWVWLRSRHWQDSESMQPQKPATDLIWALAGITAVLISPHLNPHDLTLLIFPAWIIGSYASSGVWSSSTSRMWFFILWAGYAIGPLILVNPQSAVLPGVLLMVVASVLLARQIIIHQTAHTATHLAQPV